MHLRPSLASGLDRYAALMLLASLAPFSALSQVNHWTKPGSGSWEEPYWSLGTPPALDHRVVIGNPGWKAVQITGNTVQAIPDSLSVYSIDVTSPVDSFNTLLLNYAGFERPLTVKYSMTIGNNAALTMHASALRIQTPTGVGLFIGGTVNQNDFTQVTGNQADVGWVGPGVYNLNSGLLQLEHIWVGGPYAGVFNQNGGSNATRIVHLEPGGVYNFRGGDFNGEVYFTTNAIFRQDGGRFHADIPMYGGKYILNGGVNYGRLRVPVSAGYSLGKADAIQNGGTNFGSISLGGNGAGFGRYILSNGVVQAPTIDVRVFGGFQLVNGTVTTPAPINVHGSWWDRCCVDMAFFTVDGGSLSSSGISMDTASFRQDGGTNRVAGDLKVGPGTNPSASTAYTLNGGLLTTGNTSVAWDERGGFFHSGGTHRIANELSIFGQTYSDWQGYVLSSDGELIVSNITIHAGAKFTRSNGGTIAQSGTLNVIAGNLQVGQHTQQFGPLKLSIVPGNQYIPAAVDSTLTMYPFPSCVVRFGASAGQPWDPRARLIISNWHGAFNGYQIFFGNSAAALSPAQLRQIFFSLNDRMYPAKILSTGEIVPNPLPPLAQLPDGPTNTIHHRLRFFIHPQLASQMSPAVLRSRLAGYVTDLNTIFAKNTIRRFDYNPVSDVTVIDLPDSALGYYPGTLPETGYELWAVVKSSADSYPYGGYKNITTNGAGVAAGLYWEAIHDRNAIANAAGTPGMYNYLTQLRMLAVVFEQVFGAGKGAYSIDYMYDPTGVAPYSTAQFHAWDPYWSQHQDYFTDPLFASMGGVSLADSLRRVRFAHVSAAMINAGYRNGFPIERYVPDLSATTVWVFRDVPQNPIVNAWVRVWDVSQRTDTATEIFNGLSDSSGKVQFAWNGGDNNEHNTILIKVYPPAASPKARWFTFYDAQEQKMVFGRNRLDIYMNMAANPVAPALSLRRDLAGNLILSWSAAAIDYVLENTRELGLPNWQYVPTTPESNGSQVSLLLPTDRPSAFFRLRRP